MASPARILANRDNALHSTGPRTAAGKSASAANSTKHGLSSAFTVLPNEDPAEYNEIFDGYIDEFDPAGYHETFLVHQMIQARWRIVRIHRLEHAYLEYTHLDHPDDDADNAILKHMAAKGVDVLNALSRYTAAAQRSYFKAHKELREGRQAKTHQETADVRKETAEARREIAETERAIDHYCSAPLPRLAASERQRPLESNPHLAPQVPNDRGLTHATRQTL